jgi:hypothetical protein
MACVLQAATPDDQIRAAAFICAAHAIVTASRHVVFVTHNDFQAVSIDDTVGLVPRWTGMGPDVPPTYCHVPHACCVDVASYMTLYACCPAGRTLNSTERMDAATFAAYVSSHPDRWGKQPGHYCCQMHQLGCPVSGGSPSSLAAALARINQAFANKTLNA